MRRCSRRCSLLIVLFSLATAISYLILTKQFDWRYHYNRWNGQDINDSATRKKEQHKYIVNHIDLKKSGELSVDRKYAINNHCINSGRGIWSTITNLARTKRQLLLQHLMVNDAKQVIYCKVPQVIPYLAVQLERPHHQDYSSQWDFKPLIDFTTTEIEDKLKYYFKFMFIKEPLDRLFSAYEALQGENNTFQMRKSLYTHHNRKIKTNEQLNLEYFLRLISPQGYMDMNENWLPTHILCQPCHVRYDFVGHYKTSVKDFAWILNRLHINWPIFYHLSDKTLNRTLVQNAYSNVPKSVIRTVLQKYKKDYEMFGYKPQL